MQTESQIGSPSRPKGRVGRVLWIVGCCLLLVLSTAITYALLVLGGR